MKVRTRPTERRHTCGSDEPPDHDRSKQERSASNDEDDSDREREEQEDGQEGEQAEHAYERGCDGGMLRVRRDDAQVWVDVAGVEAADAGSSAPCTPAV